MCDMLANQLIFTGGSSHLSTPQAPTFLNILVCVHTCMLGIRTDLLPTHRTILLVNVNDQCPSSHITRPRKINVRLLSNPRLSFTAVGRTNPRLQSLLILICLSGRLLPTLHVKPMHGKQRITFQNRTAIVIIVTESFGNNYQCSE